MSFGKLLAAGRSLMGGQNGSGRYQMGKHARLPKFVSPKNPFATTERVTAQPSVMTNPLPEKTIGESPVRQAPSTLAGAKGRPLRINWQVASAFLGRLWAKLKSLPRRTVRVGLKREKKFSSIEPVQAELRLEKVRVVRNDLSESDLEVVAVSEKSRPASEAPVREPMVAETVSAGGEKNWSQLATRFFGSGDK